MILSVRGKLSERRGGRFERCFIVFGYYISLQDLSLSKTARDSIITSVYYPIFHDAHNWNSPTVLDLWKNFGELSEEEKGSCGWICRKKRKTNWEDREQMCITAF